MLVCVRRRVSASVCASVFGFGFPFWFDGARGGGTVGLAGSFVNAENLSSRSVVIIVIIIIVVVVVVVIIIMTTIVDVHVRKRG